MRALIFIVALVAFSGSASAEGAYQSADELRLVNRISIKVVDQVVDGCLQNPTVIGSEAEAILRQSGIEVVDDSTEQRHRLVIAAAGRQIKLPGAAEDAGWCVVKVDVDVARFIPAPEGHLAAAWAYKSGAIVGGDSTAKSQENIQAAVANILIDFAKEAMKARGQ